MASPARKPAPHEGPIGREDATLDRIRDLLTAAGFAPPGGEIWFGDDAAVLGPAPQGSQIVLCSDAAVAGVHADLDHLGLADFGWRAVVAALSDVAAMGAIPWRMVVSVAAPPSISVVEIMEGAVAAGVSFNCPIVGGDLTSSEVAMVDVSVTGLVPSGTAMTRSSAQAGDAIFVTGSLGRSALGLEFLRVGQTGGPEVDAHRRPQPRIQEGSVARTAGVRCAMDVSDGLSRDLDRLARSSGVGIDLTEVAASSGATEGHALSGGEDYELILVTSDANALKAAFAAASLREPRQVGKITNNPTQRTLRGETLPLTGWSHDVA